MNVFFKRTVLAWQLVLIGLISFSTARAAGEIDPTFNGGAFMRNGASAIARQPADGKILVGGGFTTANGLPRAALARFNGADGSLDASFNSPLSSTLSAVRVIVPLADGKILVGGTGLVGSPRRIIIRLNGDGSVDDSFQHSTSGSGASGTVYDIHVLPDGKIIIAGDFSYGLPSGSGDSRNKLARLNPDGTTDLTFAPAAGSVTIEDIEAQPDGKIVGALTNISTAGFLLKRFNADGSDDAAFTAFFSGSSGGGNSNVTALKIQPDGKILVGGSFGFVNNTAKARIARLNQDGNLDETFNTTSPSFPVNDIELDVNGKIIVAGVGSSISGAGAIVRLLSDGSLDSTFNFVTNPALPVYIGYEALPLPDGKILLVGYEANSVYSNSTLVRVNADGATDETFSALVGGSSSVNSRIEKIVPQPDGKILVAGVFSALSGARRTSFGRFNFDGSADTTFAPQITPASAYRVNTIGLQPDGKILVGGFFDGRFIRLNADGSRDTTFNVVQPFSFYPFDIVVQSDGKIIAAGSVDGSSGGAGRIVRFNPDGSVDTTFTTVSADEAIQDVFVQPDGKLLVGGSFGIIAGAVRGNVARLNANGTLDTSFNPLGGAAGRVYEVGLQADGKIVIGGSFFGINGTSQANIARLNPNGTLDATFTPSVSNFILALKLQPDGKILIGGGFTTVNGAPRNRIARLNADGTTDTTFQVGEGLNNAAYSIALTSNNKILVGGSFSTYNNIGKHFIVRLLNDAAGRTRFDFDGDGRADLAVFRPSNGFWYQLRSANNSFNAVNFGLSNDRIAPADYDGDGKTDIAVFRDVVPGAGNDAYFYILNSTNNAFVPVQFGSTGDVPVSGDWDGDGKADLAVYREGAAGAPSYFYYRPSSQPNVNFRQILWGTTGDKPLVGDFDGDGRIDAAVFRPSMTTWFILQSSSNQVVQTTFGVSTDIPVPADFDGDGRANIAVFRPSSGTWFTSTNAATNYGAVNFGTNGDLPVPADYDGDGRADVAVYRPSNGAWYLLRSTQGFAGAAFGLAEDKPIPNAFIR